MYTILSTYSAFDRILSSETGLLETLGCLKLCVQTSFSQLGIRLLATQDTSGDAYQLCRVYCVALRAPKLTRCSSKWTAVVA